MTKSQTRITLARDGLISEVAAGGIVQFMKHAQVIEKNGTWWMYERTESDLPPRWFVIKTRGGRFLWATVKYFIKLQAAREFLNGPH